MAKETNIERFAEAYARELSKDVARWPDEYDYGVDQVPAVVTKMVAALQRGSANKSNAMRRACTSLGIKFNNDAIKAFLNGGV